MGIFPFWVLPHSLPMCFYLWSLTSTVALRVTLSDRCVLCVCVTWIPLNDGSFLLSPHPLLFRYTQTAVTGSMLFSPSGASSLDLLLRVPDELPPHPRHSLSLQRLGRAV